MQRPLRFLAGPQALARIKAEGLHEDLFDTMAGASGGPKWLTLTRLDRAIFGPWFRQRTRPLALVGSSIGCWRFACLARRDPVAVSARFEDTYLNYEVAPPVTAARLTQHCLDFLDAILGEDGADEILHHPCMRLSILAVRMRGLAGRHQPLPMSVGLAGAALANLLTRRSLSMFFERTLVHDQRAAAPFTTTEGFATHVVGLTENNLVSALLASAAVPFVFDPVTGIEGGKPGLYLDGGIMDYHLDLAYSAPGLVLYPHFSSRIVPGWFDKALRWRRPNSGNLDRMLLLCPSPEFVAALPYGRIPDRADFRRLPTTDRLRFWRRVVAETDRLADVWREAVARDQIIDWLEPLSP